MNPRSLAIGDFNGDLILDIAVANVFGNSLSILLGLGNGNFSTATNFSVGTSPASVAIGDFNGDGEFDVVMGHLFSNNVSILLGFGNGTFSVATNLVVGSRPQSVAIGDFNGDGNLDVAVGDIANRNISIILGAGDGTFSAATNFTVGLQPSSIAIGDFNVDSKLDLAVTNVSSHNVSILLNTTVTNEPPNCTDAFPSISQIWPPNHKMIDIQINGVTDPDGDPVTITITKITQDEPLNTFGDGNFDPDGSGIGTSVAQVRAERTGTKKVPGNGRVYRIWYTASDGKGGECKSSVVVCVPHDKGKSSVCIDDGQRYNSVTGELEIIPSGIAVELNDKLGIDRGEALPASFNLSNAYPNPFNPSTVIKYALPEASFVTLKIYNMLGQEIKTLVNSDKNAGTYTVQWNGDNNFGIKVASGTYIYRIVTGNYVQSNKMILLK
ncbi:MAG: T9SS type A sorting domain-containing protein [Bacteroidetes bacterium]|nr:T9SS type A sorting domain-containing protein [Bacteroidota bacterium]